jgi:hypothetical protein
MLADPHSNLMMDLIRRTTGPLKFRFILQPSMAILLAVRDGLRASREGRTSYFWEFCTRPAERRKLWGECWKSTGKIFILAFVLDCLFQLFVLHWFHLYGALIVAFVLAVVPYVIVRGPVTRLARYRERLAHSTVAETSTSAQSGEASPVRKAS